jgi:hypothetical protein
MAITLRAQVEPSESITQKKATPALRGTVVLRRIVGLCQVVHGDHPAHTRRVCRPVSTASLYHATQLADFDGERITLIANIVMVDEGKSDELSLRVERPEKATSPMQD